MDPRRFFTDADLEAVSEAAKGAEDRTSGEIVPYVVGACDEYPEAGWKAAAFGLLAGAAGGFAAHFLGGFWGGSVLQWIVVPAVVLAFVGCCLCRWVPAVRRSFVRDEILDLRARRRAAVAFVDEEVFSTRDRTGILIFVAVFEHRVIVMGDAGINRAVPDGAWAGIVDDLVAGIRSGDTASALIGGIAECGRLLEKYRVEIRPDDTDELPNELRLRER
ncbi:MAG: hypothetical protein V2I67_05030 [Thermoanaerobaculales bacterium]|nr:hypothetical protein [Thermoanaerobaculales bacterium]